ncbi:MAG: CsbD family protein [Deltaproteobacteria bacterium]|nr:CsbD family protein [Deltaproteobacteria bacterium]
MNWNQIEGQWNQLKGEVKAKWGKLTDDDLTTIGGKKDQLVGKLQEHYGLMKDDAEKQLDAWIANAKPSTSTKKQS